MISGPNSFCSGSMIDYLDIYSRFDRAIQRRRAAEETLREAGVQKDPEETELRAQLSRTLQGRNEQLHQVETEFESVLSVTEEEFSQESRAAELEHTATLKSIESTFVKASSAVEQSRDDSSWVVSSVLDETAADGPVREFERFKTLLHKAREEQAAELENLQQKGTLIFEAAGLSPPLPPEPEHPPEDRDQAASRFSDAAARARQMLDTIKRMLLPKLVSGLRSVIVFILIGALVGGPVFLFVDPSVAGVTGGRMQGNWIGIAAGCGAACSLIITIILVTLANGGQRRLLTEFHQSVAEAGWAHQHWLRLAREQLDLRQKESERDRRTLVRERAEAIQRFEQAHADKVAAIQQERNRQLEAETSRYASVMAELNHNRDENLRLIHEEHDRQRKDASLFWEDRVAQAEVALAHHLQSRQQYARDLWGALKEDWQAGCEEFLQSEQELKTIAAGQFPDWETLARGDWKAPREIPDHLPVGNFHVDLNVWPNALPEDPRLIPSVSGFQIPCLLRFPDQVPLLLRCPTAAARQQGVQALQSMVLRLLTSVPPGKLRLTILDPVGLGESFSGFMHLADFDELLITSRIWTEMNQMEARLADLTEHMENVLQKYLRNEFATIEDYNASAGEVAEPYHVLVISDFPAKFSEIAARRLVSIVHSGPRCGVYTLMTCDSGRQLPNNFLLEDIEERMTCFEWRSPRTAPEALISPEGSLDAAENFMRRDQPLLPPPPARGVSGSMAFHARNHAFPDWPLRIETPPLPEEFTSIVRMVGNASKDARRVEVAFERIAPDPKSVWAGDSRSSIEVPLGRAGATKLQSLRLGKGTSQHVLVAGKTGSGKSTFLHILITNLALHYSPEEVNFYLIDFKKGVEFKCYAAEQLPHARVIAVESDREFGVSTLQKLDEVLQERGELFRRHGVQDIAGYRNQTRQPLPRILLIVDEFQEFFIEDDRLSQSATLLLDRLVRQGRAFGIHVILGSQTLGGAYTLARSTLGQVAVRVALQCSEADAHLILSEENTAARLLTRPGEAIYNDANGLAEGNHPFQIAWLEDAQRDAALQLIRDRALRRGLERTVPVVFEGNIPSDLSHNQDLAERIDQHSTRKQPQAVPEIWLGDAVEIAPPTRLEFPAQSGSHLLLVGQDEEAARGILAAGIIALAAGRVPGNGETWCWLFDGNSAGSSDAVQWNALLGAIPQPIPRRIPGQTRETLETLTAELQKREENATPESSPLFLVIDNVAKFRELRKAEDDYGMGSLGSSGGDKPVESGKLLADLLARGPAVGIHVLVWCDSSNNLERWFSRQTLRELERRVAFQMNASDSSNLIDSPAASRLGLCRALLYREETGTAEKFRPYGIPDAAWLTSLRQRLQYGPASDFATDLEEFSIL